MKSLFFVSALFLATPIAWASQPQDATTCTLVYVKHADQEKPPYFDITCDGEDYMGHPVQDESALENPAEFKAALANALKQMMGGEEHLQCETQDNAVLWSTTCKRI